MPGKLARYIGYTALLFAAGIIVWFIAAKYIPPQWVYADKIAQIEKLVVKIDKYKSENGKYPPENTIIPGLSDIFYNVEDNGYRIGFSVGFDENYYYDSKSKKWSFK